MKKRVELAVFSCDFAGCKRRIKIEKTPLGEVFPYPQGWVYLHTFNWKRSVVERNELSEGRIQDISDKHFCCRKHLIGFIDELVMTDLTEAKEDLRKKEKSK